MGQQEIRYCSSPDGTRIAYTTYGGGGPALVIFPGWAITFQMELEFEEGVRFYQRLSERRMVVRYDLRGMGASSRKVTDLSIEAHNADAEAVISALGLETYDIFGCAFDSPVALLHAHLHAQAPYGASFCGRHTPGATTLPEIRLRRSSSSVRRTGRWAPEPLPTL